MGATALLISFRCPSTAEESQALQARIASEWWAELQKAASILAMHILEHNHAATNTGAATACYDDAHLELAHHDSERWNILIEVSEAPGMRCGGVKEVESLVRRLQEDDGLHNVKAQSYGLICTMS